MPSKKHFVFLLVLIFLLLYFFMIMSTNKVTEQVKEIFLGKIQTSQIDNKLLYYYNDVNRLKERGYCINKIKFNLVRVFVFHNFISKGCIGVFFQLRYLVMTTGFYMQQRKLLRCGKF